MESFSVDTIICPKCHAELAATADACDRCGSLTRSQGAEVTVAGTAALEETDRLRDRPWMMTILLLHLGLFGIPLYWQSRYSRNVRIMIVLASILYTVLVIVVIVAVVGWMIAEFQNAAR